MSTQPKKLTKTKLQKLQQLYPDWKLNSNATKISKEFSFAKHVEALIFIMRITVQAEVVGHHPDINFTYRKVKVTLTTHDSGGISKRDEEMMKRIEALHSSLAASG